MLVFVEDAAESITAVDAELRELPWIGDRFRERTQQPGVGQSAMGPVLVMELFVLAQYPQEMGLVPGECPVQQLVAAGRIESIFRSRNSCEARERR